MAICLISKEKVHKNKEKVNEGQIRLDITFLERRVSTITDR